ncbi:DNA-binding protein [Pseudomonas aeruginosa]
MSLRKAYAATLQWLRIRRGLSNSTFKNRLIRLYISRLEASTTSATVDLTSELADALGVTPLSFFTLLAAANEGKTPRTALIETLAELQIQGLLDEKLPAEPQKLPPPRQVAAAEKLRAIRALKEAGLSQAEVCKKLGWRSSTVGRMWHVDE